MTPAEKQQARERARMMADHPSKRGHFKKWEEQFREMDKDTEAVNSANRHETNERP